VPVIKSASPVIPVSRNEKTGIHWIENNFLKIGSPIKTLGGVTLSALLQIKHRGWCSKPEYFLENIKP